MRRQRLERGFPNLLAESGGWRPSCPNLTFYSLGEEEATLLEVPFSEAEVFKALSACNGDKAPRPDGFYMAFRKFCWDVVKEAVMGVFMDFHQHGKFVKRLNASLLVLIPKKGGAEELKDFRPISLVGSLYKLWAKVLAKRLKKVVGKVVSQYAFVEGRQIIDASLITNEAIDSLLKRNAKWVICKLDIEKDYDHVNWKFLLFVLRNKGFGEK